MRQKILAIVTGGVLKFESVLILPFSGGADFRALRKWVDNPPKSGPWVCKVCQESVGAEGERVAVWVDLTDPNHFEVMHREHAA